MQSRLEANLPGIGQAGADFSSGQLPAFVAAPFGTAMAQSVLLPALVILVGVVAVFFLRRHNPETAHTWQASREQKATAGRK